MLAAGSALALGLGIPASPDHLGLRLVFHAVDHPEAAVDGPPEAGAEQLGDAGLGVDAIQAPANGDGIELAAVLPAHAPQQALDVRSEGGIRELRPGTVVREIVGELQPHGQPT